jgi:hypothetical protein
MSETDAAMASTDLSALAVALLKGVIYRENDATSWNALLSLQARVRDYVGVLGLELVLDEAEGYAFLRSPQSPEREAEQKTPRLIARRPLSFPVSLLLALLRKKLAEFDASGSDTRLVLSRDAIVDLVRVFLPDTANEAKLIDQIDAQINKIVELGFLRRLKTEGAAQRGHVPTFEVRRIIKAFIDAQWLVELDARLAEYRQQLTGETRTASDE